MKKLLALTLLFAISTPALAWFDKGHMVAARLAWKNLQDRQRSQVVALLKKHPHYEEFLRANRPEGFSEDEWVFLRAATWPDWVGLHHRDAFHHPTWHFINYPFVPPDSHADADRHQPKAEGEHLVQALKSSVKKIETGTDAEKAIYLCWLLHLVGDIHQPLHCVQMVSEQFPTGDQGGNLVLIRTRTQSNPIKLHVFWDSLLGTSVTACSIGKSAREIESVLKDKAAAIQPDLDAHTTFESWAKESFELAKTAAYLNGELKFGHASEKSGIDDSPEVPVDYVSNAGRLARMQIGKASVRLAEQLGKLFP